MKREEFEKLNLSEMEKILKNNRVLKLWENKDLINDQKKNFLEEGETWGDVQFEEFKYILNCKKYILTKYETPFKSFSNLKAIKDYILNKNMVDSIY